MNDELAANVRLDQFDGARGRWNPETPTGAEDIRGWQLQAAWSVAQDLSRSNPYYLGAVDQVDARDEASFQALPTTRKDDVVADCAAKPPYGTRTVARASEIRHVVETSGTSGKGKEIYALNDADELAIFRAEAVGYWWAGVRPGSRVLLTLPIGVTAAGQWYYGGLRLLGANVFSVGSYPTEKKVEVLARYGADLIVGTPSYIQRLASAVEEQGLNPADLAVRALMVAGEPYTQEWAERIQRRWGGARLHEQYGCTERALAWTCAGGVLSDDGWRTLHFPPENAYVEVVDPQSGEHVANGEQGELVVTPLVASASPLLRFATGDRVTYVSPGSCECELPLGGIVPGSVERYDDMIKVRGINVWPRAVDDAVLTLPEVVEYRAVIESDDQGRESIEVRVELNAEGEEDRVLLAVQEAIYRCTGLRVVAAAAPAGAVTRSVPGGFTKISRWRDARRTKQTAV